MDQVGPVLPLQKKIHHGIVPIFIIGVVACFAFVLHAVAAGIVPADVIALANAARSKAGLATLHENATLAQAAKNKANDMIKNDYFAHTSPKGVEPWHWMKEAGYRYSAAGENLAINYTNAKEQHTAWMNSETHKSNILSTRYKEIGVAVVTGKIDGKESIVTVEMFGTPVVAVLDKVAPVPLPIANPEPAIQGVETPVIPSEESATLPAPTSAAPTLPTLQSNSPSYLQVFREYAPVFFVLLILLSIVLPPFLMLYRAWQHINLMKHITHGVLKMPEMSSRVPHHQTSTS